MKQSIKTVLLTALVCGIAFGSLAVAKADGDVGITISSGKLATGLIAEDGGTYTPNIRVFDSEVTDELIEGVWNTEEPGFQSYENLTPNIKLRINFLSPLMQWDGSKFVNSSSTLSMNNPNGSGMITTCSGKVDGFWMSANSDGYFHQHPIRTINGTPDDGIYMLLANLESDNHSVSSSDSFAILYSKNADESEMGNAISYAQANAVPEPSGMLALITGAAGLFTLRRKK